MTWPGVPPTLIPPPTGAPTVVLDSGNNAAGAASIAAAEIDYYSFIAPVSGAYTISTDTPALSGLDTVLGIFSATGQRLAYNDDVAWPNTDSQLTINLSAATRYYVGITNYSSSEQGSYGWVIDGPDVPQTPTIDLSGAALSASNATGWGKTITVQARVQNTGNTDSGTFLARWYLARNRTATTGRVTLQRTDADRSSVRIANLAPGESIDIDVTLRLPSKAPSGWSGTSFYVVMGTDVGSEVGETNEKNNLGQVGAGFDSAKISIGGSTGAAPTGSFSIGLNMSGLTSSQRTIFQRAADRWEQVIVGNLPNATYQGETVDDLLIHSSARSIDGVNGILGRAGPDAFRSGSDLPYHGIMEFDSADLASMESRGLLFSVVLHEMGHVLGIGTIWEERGLLSGRGGSNPIFTGSQARAAYNQLFGVNASGVPVEATGGSGTAYAHWRDSIFTTELMTGWAGPGTNLPLSVVTAASLADLGYTVNIAAADSYTPSSSARSAALQASGGGTASIVAMLDGIVPNHVTEAMRSSKWSSTEFASEDMPSPAKTIQQSSGLKSLRQAVSFLEPRIVDSLLTDTAEHKSDLAETPALTTSMDRAKKILGVSLPSLA
jgi:hypothetical protein